MNTPMNDEPIARGLAPLLVEADSLCVESLQLVRAVLELYPPQDPLVEAIFAVLLEAPTRGHTCQSAAEIADFFRRALAHHDAGKHNDRGPSDRDVEDALRQAHDILARWAPQSGSALPATPLVEILGRLYTHRYAAQEVRSAQAIARRAQAPGQPRPSLEHLIASLPTMREAQARAARYALEHPLVLLTGGPGTGKTWTVRNVLAAEIADALNHGSQPPRIALAAPTGKAAARMIEALLSRLDEFLDVHGRSLVHGDANKLEQLRSALTHLEASTLHRLLGVSRPGARSTYNPHRALVPADLVVVDEVSMVDATMMTRLLDSLAPQTRLILIGDPQQLTSVEAGSVLADLVRLGNADGRIGACVVELTESTRFKEDTTVGRVVLDTKRGAATQRDAWAEVVHEVADERTLPQRLIQRFAERYKPLVRAAQSFATEGDEGALQALKALGNFQILCTNRRGWRGVQEVNERIIDCLVRERVLRSRGEFAPGTPLMILRNDYANGLYNGDIGVVVSPEHVAFPSEDGGVRYLHPSRLPKHQVAFAFTIHKSQGSEWDEVTVLLPSNDSAILTRELVYTGLSRAKSKVEVIGSWSMLELALSREAARATGLEALTQQLLDFG